LDDIPCNLVVAVIGGAGAVGAQKIGRHARQRRVKFGVFVDDVLKRRVCFFNLYATYACRCGSIALDVVAFVAAASTVVN
jgi:hypothetical protein